MRTLDENTFPQSGTLSSEDDRWLIMKFGGSSVSTAGNWAIIRDLVRERQDAGYKVVVVHSALMSVSNGLEKVLDAAVSGEHEPILRQIFDVHLDLARDLGLDGEAVQGEYMASLEQLLAGIRLVRDVSPRVHVKVMALGELMATSLGAAYLQSQGIDVSWVDARDVLRSIEVGNENERTRYLVAKCAFDPDRELREEFSGVSGIVLTQGFIARNEHGEGVLLGRGGSDTSAAYFAAKLQAFGMEIWTDVPGMFSANPRKVSGARLLKALSYEQAQEIASMGGSVLHPRCLRPLRHYAIPLRVRCTARPEMSGTLISNDPGSDAPRVKAISSRSGITVVSMETVGMWHEVGFLSEAFRCFSDLGLSVDLVSTGESNVTVTLDPGVNLIDSAILSRLTARLSTLCRVTIIDGTEVVSLVGQKIRAMLHVIGPALEVFEENRIHLVSQAASDLNLSFVVEEGQAHRLIQKLHASLVKPTADDAVFGLSWEEFQQDSVPVTVHRQPWWAVKREQLLEIAARETSAYVYDLETVQAACERLTSLQSVDRVFFAVKANNHPGVLRTVESAGVNLECVSPGEIRHVLDLFPDIDRDRILFTPNFAPRIEYEQALKEGVRVTLDNLHPLKHWSELFAGQELILRLDTGQGRGHHEHVRTAGVNSKFGIPLFELEEAGVLLEKCGAKVVGLHAHTGSGILRLDNWQNVAASLLEAARQFPDIRFLDLGGGLGVPEKPGEQPLDMSGLDASLAEIRADFPDLELWLEPGRYIVAEAGVLLATVTQIKGKGELQYVGVSTGMNSLIRPALYGAYHEIANLTRLDEPSAMVVNVVGPICETGDRLGNDRRLPRCEEGDVLLVANTGAYGYVMGLRYNLREPATEVTLPVLPVA
jgi:diaminopimelate decarboxylase/aspartate kinase